MTRTILTAVALTLACMATQGCAVLLTGYLIGDSMQRDKAIATCRANLQTTNNDRIAHGKEPFPDQCGH